METGEEKPPLLAAVCVRVYLGGEHHSSILKA